MCSADISVSRILLYFGALSPIFETLQVGITVTIGDERHMFLGLRSDHPSVWVQSLTPIWHKKMSLHVMEVPVYQ